VYAYQSKTFSISAIPHTIKGGIPAMSVAVLYREELKEYDFGSGHPFRGSRYEAFIKLLARQLPGSELYRIMPAEPAGENELLRICDEDYIQFNRDYFKALHGGWTGYYENVHRYQSADNKPIGIPGDLEYAARIIIGEARTACDLVMEGKYRKVVSVGGGMHHAKRRFGEGFCIYNDVAFAALYLIDKHKLNRVMVIDTDAHAGNGTAEYLRAETKALFVDIHQDPRTIYPGTGFSSEIGADSARGHTINIPLPVHAGDDSYKQAFDDVIIPVAQEFKPQIVIRNGGSDPHYNDGLTNLGMTMAGFRMMGEKIRELCEVCDGKEIDLIASGYNESVLPYGWLSLVAGVMDFPVTVDELEKVPSQYRDDLNIEETMRVLDEVKKYHREYWQCFK